MCLCLCVCVCECVCVRVCACARACALVWFSEGDASQKDRRIISLMNPESAYAV